MFHDLDQEQEEAPKLMEELEDTTVGRRFMLVSGRRFQTLALCELVLERSRHSWFDDAETARHWAEISVLLSDRLDADFYGPLVVKDLQAKARGYQATAMRLLSDYFGAEESLKTAGNLASSPLVKAELLTFEASLRTCQERFEEALALREKVVTAYREHGNPRLLGMALANKAVVCWYLDRQRDAIVLLLQGLELMDPKRDSSFFLNARYNLAGWLYLSGYRLEAAPEAAEVYRLALEQGDNLTRARCEWLQGQIALDLGDTAEAEYKFQQARDEFMAQRMGLDVAEVSLELALLYERQERLGELYRLAKEILGIFGVIGLPRQAIAALRVLVSAIHEEVADRELIQRVVAVIQGVRVNPELSMPDVDDLVFGGEPPPELPEK